MSSIKSTARLAGILYLVMSVMAVLSYVGAFGKFEVPGDATATMRHIAENERVYRVAILNDFITNILFLAVVVTLYHLFVDVDRRLSLMMLVFVAVPVGMQLASLTDRMVPLSLLRNPDYLSALSAAQRDSLAHAVLRFHRNMGTLVTPFWGLWLLPFGRLVIESGYFPRVLGWLLMVAGVGYVVTGFTAIMFPDQLSTVSKIMMPLYFGELPIVFWLAIKGAREPSPAARMQAAA
jgi:hypothetical protein